MAFLFSWSSLHSENKVILNSFFFSSFLYIYFLLSCIKSVLATEIIVTPRQAESDHKQCLLKVRFFGMILYQDFRTEPRKGRLGVRLLIYASILLAHDGEEVENMVIYYDGNPQTTCTRHQGELARRFRFILVMCRLGLIAQCISHRTTKNDPSKTKINLVL